MRARYRLERNLSRRSLSFSSCSSVTRLATCDTMSLFKLDRLILQELMTSVKCSLKYLFQIASYTHVIYKKCDVTSLFRQLCLSSLSKRFSTMISFSFSGKKPYIFLISGEPYSSQ